MIPASIVKKMEKQTEESIRSRAEAKIALQCLKDLDLCQHSQMRNFFLQYKLSGVLSSKAAQDELLDIASPTSQIAEVTAYVRDTYELQEDFICLTSGEGEGFYLYSKTDRKIYDVGIEELDDLEAGKKEASWNSFYELLEWYLEA